MANSMHDVKHTLGGLGQDHEGRQRSSKADYVDLLSLLFLLVRLASTKGTMALEPHIEKPDESAAFQKFPKILGNNFASTMICDYLRMVGMNADDPNQIEDVMARELKKTLAEELHGAHALQTMADALPALGIVAAVLGVIKTMSPHRPAARGAGRDDRRRADRHLPRRAAGLRPGRRRSPHGSKRRGEEEAKYYEVIRAVLVTHLHGNAPQVSVESGRKMVPNEHMPSFQELEEAVQSVQI